MQVNKRQSINHLFFGITFIALSMLATSCVSRKKMVYFQEDISTEAQNFEPIFEPGDLLDIVINGSDSEIAADYNQSGALRQNFQNTSYENGVSANKGYLVFEDSTVTLPVLGEVKIGGLTREAATDTLMNKLKNHLTDATVSIHILNFKITVLGEVQNPGTFSVPNERINILEAIGVAKDLKITAKRNNVTVIRQEKGETKRYQVDLTSSTAFDSPAFYLKQNDVVYVEPNNKARYDASIMKATGGIIISATSLIISTLILLK